MAVYLGEGTMKRASFQFGLGIEGLMKGKAEGLADHLEEAAKFLRSNPGIRPQHVRIAFSEECGPIFDIFYTEGAAQSNDTGCR